MIWSNSSRNDEVRTATEDETARRGYIAAHTAPGTGGGCRHDGIDAGIQPYRLSSDRCCHSRRRSMGQAGRQAARGAGEPHGAVVPIGVGVEWWARAVRSGRLSLLRGGASDCSRIPSTRWYFSRPNPRVKSADRSGQLRYLLCHRTLISIGTSWNAIFPVLGRNGRKGLDDWWKNAKGGAARRLGR